MVNTTDSIVGGLKGLDAGKMADKVLRALGGITTTMVEDWQDWGDKARAATDATNDYVRNNPWQAIGAAALIGVATGMMVSTGNRRARHVISANTDDLAPSVIGG